MLCLLLASAFALSVDEVAVGLDAGGGYFGISHAVVPFGVTGTARSALSERSWWVLGAAPGGGVWLHDVGGATTRTSLRLHVGAGTRLAEARVGGIVGRDATHAAAIGWRGTWTVYGRLGNAERAWFELSRATSPWEDPTYYDAAFGWRPGRGDVVVGAGLAGIGHGDIFPVLGTHLRGGWRPSEGLGVTGIVGVFLDEHGQDFPTNTHGILQVTWRTRLSEAELLPTSWR